MIVCVPAGADFSGDIHGSRRGFPNWPVDDPKGGWGLSIFSAPDQSEVERLTAADPIILDDVGARYEILPMKQLRMKGAG